MESSHSRRVIVFVNAAHAIDHMFMLIFPTAVLSMSAAFGRSYGELLALSVGGFVAFGAASIPAGWLGDLWSRRNMLAVFFFGIGAAAILAGCSNSVAMLAVSLTLIGLFAAIYHPVGGALLASHAAKLGREIGFNGVWGNLGIAFAALITAGLAQYFGWRAAFILPGAAAMLFGAAFLLLVPDAPAPVRASARQQAAVPRRIAMRAFMVLAVATVTGGVVFNAATVSLPKLFDERLLGLTQSSLGVGALVCAVYIAGAVAQLIIGKLVDRFSLKAIFVPLSALQAPCLFIAAKAGDWGLIAGAAGLMFAIFGQVTVNDAMIVRYTAEAWRSRAYALRYFLSFSASACAVPLVAYLHEIGAASGGGFVMLFQVLAVFGLGIFLSSLFFPHRPNEVQAADAADAPGDASPRPARA
ncbi:MAG TPA: MFS transporter [Ferrovibrio sp.]|uniref:MFS transporter n=1 Tax=Ferrovibrio sp. TaxID=1917215 RepID=UPI002ED5B4D6